VVEKLRKIKGIKEVNEVLGPYDVVVEMEADRLDEVTDILRTEIRRIHGVRNTLTCVTMR
jgi:DNA-binding Lrp family transcriptional regulator